MKFSVNKYMKGTQERGYILGSVDEVMQILDDNSMNLQSMSASRFIGPFLNTVQTWEKSLSLIGEVLEVKCFVVFEFFSRSKPSVCQPEQSFNATAQTSSTL